MCAVLTVVHVLSLVRVKCFITVEILYGQCALFCDIIILYIHAFGVMLTCFMYLVCLWLYCACVQCFTRVNR